MARPLAGIRVVEMAGLAPAPFAGMVLADFGASVVRIDRPAPNPIDTLCRGKRSLAVNLKAAAGPGIVRQLCATADVLIEPYRPGVMESLGLGPEELLAANPRLIFARLTGFGQTGPNAHRAGHDINYLAASGLLSMLRKPQGNPFPPLNLLADFAGGGMTCAMGVLAALLERSTSGKGQVVDVSMVAGSAYLGAFASTAEPLGLWSADRPGTGMLDGGAPFYNTYETRDGRHMAVGAIEPKFYRALLDALGLTDTVDPTAQNDQSQWPALRQRMTDAFRTHTCAEWTAVFDGVDACVTPVLTMSEAKQGDAVAPAPQLSRTPAQPGRGTQLVSGAHSEEVLLELGLSKGEIRSLCEANVVFSAQATAQL